MAEWCNLVVLITATADRIGHEVYNLQRSEVGEVAESFVPGTVGSITMPHKRNPEISEHLGTLARVARHSAAMIAENSFTTTNVMVVRGKWNGTLCRRSRS